MVTRIIKLQLFQIKTRKYLIKLTVNATRGQGYISCRTNGVTTWAVVQSGNSPCYDIVVQVLLCYLSFNIVHYLWLDYCNNVILYLCVLVSNWYKLTLTIGIEQCRLILRLDLNKDC